MGSECTCKSRGRLTTIAMHMQEASELERGSLQVSSTGICVEEKASLMSTKERVDEVR